MADDEKGKGEELMPLAALVAIAEIVEDTEARPTRRLDRIAAVLRRAGILKSRE
jgi:hypothetical protein